MKRHIHTLVLVALSCLLFAGASYAASAEVKIARSGETFLRAVLGGKTVKITFQTAAIKRSDPGFPLALDHYDEVSIIRGISILVDGTTVWVPWSAYADLFNATLADLQLKEGVFQLLIGGAGGADLYRVVIYFNSDRVTRRESYDSFSNRPGQITIYSPPLVVG